MKDAMRNVDCLAGGHRPAFLAETHLARAFDDEVDLFLVLIMPGDLSAVGLERHMPHRKIGCLDGTRAPNQVLCAPARGIGAARCFGKVSDDHVFAFGLPENRLQRRERSGYRRIPARSSAPQVRHSCGPPPAPAAPAREPPEDSPPGTRRAHDKAGEVRAPGFAARLATRTRAAR